MNPLSEFQQVLAEAINEFADTGYISKERLDYWMGRLRLLADQSLRPSEDQIQIIRNGLEKMFSKHLRKAPKSHPQLSVRDITSIEPELRPILERRIMASAALIKLNRQQAIDMTMRRFSGWASSMPLGGTRDVKKSKVKTDISKPLRSASYETRRLLIDQGHKMAANINKTVADQYGALAYEWQHIEPFPGYDSRPEHLKRNTHIYLIRGSWAHQQGLVKKHGQWADEIDQPAEAINCRCAAVYLYSLRDLPEEALTEKGKAALKETEFLRK